MIFLEVLSRIVGIFVGLVGGLNGLVSLVQKCKPYIKRDKAETEKDPSASFPASDGSSDDRISDH